MDPKLPPVSPAAQEEWTLETVKKKLIALHDNTEKDEIKLRCLEKLLPLLTPTIAVSDDEPDQAKPGEVLDLRESWERFQNTRSKQDGQNAAAEGQGR